MRVSDQQRWDFAERGWFHLGCVFDEAELDAIRREYELARGHATS